MLKGFIRKHFIAFIFANTMALSIGVISALVFSLLGPALQFLISPPGDSEIIAFQDILGDRWAVIVEWLTGLKTITVDQLWTWLPFALVMMALIRASLLIGQWWVWEYVSEGFAFDIRTKILSKFIYLAPSKRSEIKQQEEQLSSSISNDVRLMREYIVHQYGGLPRELIQVTFYLVSLILLSPTLVFVFVFGLSPAIFALNRLGKKIRKRSGRALDDYGSLSEWLQQRLRGIETIKHFRSESIEVKSMHQLTARLRQAFLRSARAKARSGPILEFIAVMSLVLVLVVSFRMITEGVVSASVLLSFFAVLSILSQSASKLGRYFSANRDASAALSRLDTLLMTLDDKKQVEVRSLVPEKLGATALELKHVCAGYESDTMVLKDVCLSFAKNQIHCICGPSGSGKSTLFQVILGLLPVARGEIFVDSSIHSVSGQWIGYLPQKIHLAPMTIAQNIAYPDVEFDTDRVQQAMKNAGLHEDSTLSAEHDLAPTNAEGLSGGQAQRVLMARLFYHQFPVILFDEGTSALDPETEAIVFESLRSLAAQGACIIMIAHRVSAISQADKIVLLNQGSVLISGSSQEVLSSEKFQAYMTQPTAEI